MASSTTRRVLASTMRTTTQRMATKAFVVSRNSHAPHCRSLQTTAGTTNGYSFASPESDFSSSSMALPISTTAIDNAEWSHELSFTSPEADFTSCSTTHQKQDEQEWSQAMSFTSPESDFVGVSSTHQEQPTQSEWSNKLSFASPEQDFTYQPERVAEEEWSNTLSFASPESDFGASSLQQENNAFNKEDFINHVQKKSHHRDSMVYALSHAAPESDFASPHVQQLLNDRQKEQLAHVEQHQQYQYSSSSNTSNTPKDMIVQKSDIPLPSTLQEAETETDRAVVITKATYPFHIVNVNDAWVGLCGYTKEESRHRTLGELLQGNDTDPTALQDMVGQLLHGKESMPTVVTNYTKSGRKFTNRIRAGQLKDAKGEITHFVGVLQEVKEGLDHFEGTMKTHQKMDAN